MRGIAPHTGYSHPLEGQDKKAAVIYTNALWALGLSSAFGNNFGSTDFEDWLRWTGITDIAQNRYHPTLDRSAEDERRRALDIARKLGHTF